MKKLSWPELKLACNAMWEREQNHGCWKDGKIPDIMIRIMNKYYPSLIDDIQWLMVIEAVVKNNAVNAIARGEVKPSQK